MSSKYEDFDSLELSLSVVVVVEGFSPKRSIERRLSRLPVSRLENPSTPASTSFRDAIFD